MGQDAYIQENWEARLTSCLAHCFCWVRMDELFDIIADYPESHACVTELGRVLQRTGMHSQLGETLQKSLVKRLVHAGANTSQIIDVYINTIKVSRVVVVDCSLASLPFISHFNLF